MVSLKTCVSMFLLVACTVATAIETPMNNLSELPGHAIEKSTETKPEPPPVTPVISNTTVSPTNTPTPPTVPTPTIGPNTTTIAPPTTPTTPNTTTTSTTTVKPSSSSTTTVKPSTSTTVKPSSTTVSPNVTTTIAPVTTPATPSDNKSRTWDAPSFLGGMVLAFGIVAVGFVGYRFFYLGRGGAYHTL